MKTLLVKIIHQGNPVSQARIPYEAISAFEAFIKEHINSWPKPEPQTEITFDI